jgi:hypothetical protein
MTVPKGIWQSKNLIFQGSTRTTLRIVLRLVWHICRCFKCSGAGFSYLTKETKFLALAGCRTRRCSAPGWSPQARAHSPSCWISGVDVINFFLRHCCLSQGILTEGEGSVQLTSLRYVAL